MKVLRDAEFGTSIGRHYKTTVKGLKSKERWTSLSQKRSQRTRVAGSESKVRLARLWKGR